LVSNYKIPCSKPEFFIIFKFMKIYTGKGDLGQTSDLNGKSFFKDSPAIHFMGTLDELNSYLGLIKSMLSNEDAWQFAWKSACNFIEKTQKNLMKLMAHVSDNNNEKYFFADADIVIMEKEIDRLTENIPRKYELVIPGENIIEAQIQIARTVARRAERLFFAVNREHLLSPKAGAYLNRLSDYLFVLSRQESLINVNFINQITGI